MTLAVFCKDMTKTFGKGHTAVKALRGVDLEVSQGELMMVVGPSGSGKTTLLSIIAGTLDRTSGECEVFGHDFQKMNENERAKVRGSEIGFVFQSYNLIPQLSAVENVVIPMILNKRNGKEAYDKARSLLMEVGLDGRVDARPPELSGGERQRTAICRALIHDPKLIVCDEPTSALDSETGQHVVQLLKEHAETLIIVTHDERIFHYADRIVRVGDGRVIQGEKHET